MLDECMAEGLAMVRWYLGCVGTIAAWSVLGLALRCCCLDLAGAPGLAAQFFGVVGGVQLGMVVYTVTIFFPTCPESCRDGRCADDEFYWLYLVPAAEGLVALCWLRSSWSRARLAKELTREHGGGGGDAAIFSKIPGNEVDATELEMTENSETEFDRSTGSTDVV